MKVKIDDVLIALQSVNDNLCFYYDTLEERLIHVLDGYINGDNDKNAEDILDDDRYIGLPDRYDIHDYQIMNEFAYSLDNQERKTVLINALKGKGAFRRFKDAVYELEIQDMWYYYRDEKYLDIAIKWCEKHHIEIIGYTNIKEDELIDSLHYIINGYQTFYDSYAHMFTSFMLFDDQYYDIQNQTHRYYQLPEASDIDIERIMCMFARTLNEDQMNYLIDSFREYNGTEIFMNRISELKVKQAYIKYEYQALKQIAIEWCEDNNLILEE